MWRSFYFFAIYWVGYVRSFKNGMLFPIDIWPREPEPQRQDLFFRGLWSWAQYKSCWGYNSEQDDIHTFPIRVWHWNGHGLWLKGPQFIDRIFIWAAPTFGAFGDKGSNCSSKMKWIVKTTCTPEAQNHPNYLLILITWHSQRYMGQDEPLQIVSR